MSLLLNKFDIQKLYAKTDESKIGFQLKAEPYLLFERNAPNVQQKINPMQFPQACYHLFWLTCRDFQPNMILPFLCVGNNRPKQHYKTLAF